MVRIVVPQPDSEQTRSFRTHASYVRAFRELALGESTLGIETATKQLHSVAADHFYEVSGKRRQGNLSQVTSCLRRAWTTASLIEATHSLAEDSDIVRLANGWSAVQAYYVLYNAAQSLLVAEGHERPRQHEQTKRQFANLWTNRAARLAPWCLAAAHPTVKGASKDGFLSGPNRVVDTTLHPWTAWQGDQAWDIAAKALRTTRAALIEDRLKKARERKFADRRKAWQTDCEKLTSLGKKPRSQPKSANLTLSERDAVERGTRAVTVADYLYRLRVKANYDDITVFAEGPTSDAEAAALAADLVDLANATLVVHEVRLADRIGSKALVRLMDEVLLKSNSYTSHLSLRRDLHAGL